MSISAWPRALAIVAVICCSMGALDTEAAAKGGKAKVLPPDIDWDHEFLEKHHEPALWTFNALARHRSRLRMSVEGSACLRFIIRIDEAPNGEFNGTYTAEQRCNHKPRRTTVIRFTVPAQKITDFRVLAHDKDILQRSRQSGSEENLCVDGLDVLIEQVDVNGYRVAEANIPCTAQQEFVDVSLAITDLANAREARELIQ